MTDPRSPFEHGSLPGNTGKARITGFEGEFLVEPINNFLVNASVGLIDFKYRDLGTAAGVPGGPTLDSVPPYSPKWKYSIGAPYTAHLASGAALSSRLDWTYQAKTFNDLTNAEAAASPAYGLLDAHSTLASANNRWQV